MNSLLKRQIRKFLTPELAENKELEKFLLAVDKSYDNFDEQSMMIQRAMKLSSEELYHANNQLRKESQAQKQVIEQLRNIINTLKLFELSSGEITDNLELDGSKLADYVNNQAKEIVTINKHRDDLLKNLEKQNEALSDYAHMVSHDLKSPLRSIDVLSLWLLEDFGEKLGEEGVRNLELIRNNVQKMEDLIIGILDYSTIDKGDTDFYDVDIDFKVKDILKTTYIPEHIEVNILDKLPVIKGDKLRLSQLFQNLIGNAIKYNDKEKGIINIGVTPKRKYWEFYIQDNGKGIEEQYFKKIFKTFEKLENNPNSTGIGLAIVKKIIEFYKGKIWLTSEIGKGTTFYFTLKK
ncbi:His Kinase A (phospho-acceptor) domain-containing protein [Pustulibacterium marinum]|uniref:histidine kinase n=1 Tax=Pustulibacterium marinum TaxID=1224947 RepID=A0A1I7EUD6_9FLAO|nr:ATP-binding protein [Pustulibacterium marinum]SFU27509.1 His Kinase A (phospho-acceptor) domain-containing protein [Pustulibacterium marinum]